jgi:hypothetical protein
MDIMNEKTVRFQSTSIIYIPRNKELNWEYYNIIRFRQRIKETEVLLQPILKAHIAKTKRLA